MYIYMAKKKGGLARKGGGGGGGKGGQGEGATASLTDQLQRKRIVVLDAERCKPGSEAFEYLSRSSRLCPKDCIRVQSRADIMLELGLSAAGGKAAVAAAAANAAKAAKNDAAAGSGGGGGSGATAPVVPAGRVIISEDACAQCLLRAKKCPGGAVRVVNLPTNLETDCTHRYGPNAFKLHGLPSPRAGCVLGLLGTNGIGKSTALKVLAGKLKPNLGRLNDPPHWEEILAYYRGSDLQSFLTRLLEGDMRCVTKVQLDTDYVRKLRGRVVGEVLRQRDERGCMDALVKKFELEAVLTREVQELSGGELQRFAICVVCLQDADVYMFDEASSFLDIKQRMTATEVIRSLKDLPRDDGRPRYVVVVEHDLAVLDYMSDYVNCIYGEPGAYGVITKVATVTNGINNYLAGYFPAENMRFRPEAISFSVSASGSAADSLITHGGGKGAPTTTVDYPDISRTLHGTTKGKDGTSRENTFTLHIESGHFQGAECIGLLGQNGSGKTTFMDMLAGHVNDTDADAAAAEESECSLAGLGVSYKRQVYAPKLRKYKGTVQGIIERQLQSMCADRLFKLLVIKPLKIDELYRNDVSTLSGGELQRLAIVLCLGTPASVYLLDEPSAGLDCEQRVIAAKVIRRWIVNHLGKIAMVIEHDFVMASALSDKVVVYDGHPGVECWARSPVGLVPGFNSFLRQLDVTFRRDPTNARPRVNKPGSQNDQEQKQSGQLFTFDVDMAPEQSQKV